MPSHMHGNHDRGTIYFGLNVSLIIMVTWCWWA